MARNPKALPSIDWSGYVADGEDPSGMISQTANGTIREGRGGDGSQYRFSERADGGWNDDPMPGNGMNFPNTAMPVPAPDPVFVKRRRG